MRRCLARHTREAEGTAEAAVRTLVGRGHVGKVDSKCGAQLLHAVAAHANALMLLVDERFEDGLTFTALQRHADPGRTASVSSLPPGEGRLETAAPPRCLRQNTPAFLPALDSDDGEREPRRAALRCAAASAGARPRPVVREVGAGKRRRLHDNVAAERDGRRVGTRVSGDGREVCDCCGRRQGCGRWTHAARSAGVLWCRRRRVAVPRAAWLTWCRETVCRGETAARRRRRRSTHTSVAGKGPQQRHTGNPRENA
eukprot:352178-Chlamydomonas_euryale.AAC.4